MNFAISLYSVKGKVADKIRLWKGFFIQQTSPFRELLISTAIDGIEKQSKEKFDRKSELYSQ